ncbi:DNA-binding protein [Colletotrichum camelliae]|nr:DNA-binding protein [Colletotrichum camelliae]
MKGKEEVISEFNEYVNMTAEELESWLKSGDSNSAGWPKDDAEGDGETVGHDSGRNIVEILKANPDKKEDEYTDDQVEHMRKVVAYCKRHLAQEAKGNSEKSPEEVKKTKSYASLKNWGHDFLKAQGKEGGEQNGKSAKSKNGDEEKAGSNGSKKEESNGSSKKEKNGSKKKGEEEEEVEEEVEQADEGKEEEEEEEADEEKTGDKRKKSSEENGSNKKRQTRQGEGKATKKDENGKDEKEEEEAEDDGDEEMEDDDEEGDDKENGTGKKTKKGPKKGDKVSWQWGNGNPEGKVLDVKEEKTTIETKNGNEVSRDGNPDDPAVVLDTGKSKAIKSNHELN